MRSLAPGVVPDGLEVAPAPLARARGVVELAFKRRGEGTVLGRLYQEGLR